MPRLLPPRVPLAIEVPSPSTSACDRETNRPRLLRAGTAEVWLVDPLKKTIEVMSRGGARLGRGDQTLRSEALPGFALTPARLFTPPA